MDHANRALRFNKLMLNLFLAMTKGVPGLPDELRSLGYRSHSIEPKFTNSRGDTVNPEMILSSAKLKHAILLEWKDGANTKAKQLRAYAHVTDDDLRSRASLMQEECSRHDVVVIGREENRERIPIGVANGKHPFPVLVTAPLGLEKIRNRFSPGELNVLFSPLLPINWNAVPSYLFPFDQSSDDWEIAEVVLPEILAPIINGSKQIALPDLRNAVFHKVWNIFGNEYRKYVSSMLCSVVNEASRKEFKTYVTKTRARSARGAVVTWDLRPLPQKFAERQAELRRLRKGLRDLIARLRSSRQYSLQFEAMNM